MNLYAYESGVLDSPCHICRGDATTHFPTANGVNHNYCADCAEKALRNLSEDNTEPHPTVVECAKCARLTLYAEQTGSICVNCGDEE